MFKLAIDVCFENHFGLIRAIFLSPESTKSVYFFWDTGTGPQRARDNGYLVAISVMAFKKDKN